MHCSCVQGHCSVTGKIQEMLSNERTGRSKSNTERQTDRDTDRLTEDRLRHDKFELDGSEWCKCSSNTKSVHIMRMYFIIEDMNHSEHPHSSHSPHIKRIIIWDLSRTSGHVMERLCITVSQHNERSLILSCGQKDIWCNEKPWIGSIITETNEDSIPNTFVYSNNFFVSQNREHT